MICNNCQIENKEGAKFCAKCGYDNRQTVAQMPKVEISNIKSKSGTSKPDITIITPEDAVKQTVLRDIPERLQEVSGGKRGYKASKMPPIMVIFGGIGVASVILIGGGVYFDKTHHKSGQNVNPQESQKAFIEIPASVNAPIEPPASATIATSISTPNPIVKPSIFVQTAPVTKSEMPNTEQTLPVLQQKVLTVKPASKEQAHAPQQEETKDDVKLLNAIDQYIDKQTQGK